MHFAVTMRHEIGTQYFCLISLERRKYKIDDEVNNK